MDKGSAWIRGRECVYGIVGSYSVINGMELVITARLSLLLMDFIIGRRHANERSTDDALPRHGTTGHNADCHAFATAARSIAAPNLLTRRKECGTGIAPSNLREEDVDELNH